MGRPDGSHQVKKSRGERQMEAGGVQNFLRERGGGAGRRIGAAGFGDFLAKGGGRDTRCGGRRRRREPKGVIPRGGGGTHASGGRGIGGGGGNPRQKYEAPRLRSG